jgi:hypothetical protein
MKKSEVKIKELCCTMKLTNKYIMGLPKDIRKRKGKETNVRKREHDCISGSI